MRNRVTVLVLLLGLGAGRTAAAQHDAASALGDASVGAPHPGPVDPHAALPPGHPPTAADPHAGAEIQRAAVPQTFAEEAPGLAPGVVLVRVVNAAGDPQPEALVRLGAMRDGDRDTPREARTDNNGVARFEGLDRGSGIAYRASTEREGARFGAMPFQLGARSGYRVQLVRHEVEHGGRAVLLWDARVELRFKDDRIVVVHRYRVANLSGLALPGDPPHPTAYVPQPGLRFGLPAGYTAFQAAPSMDDLRLNAEGDVAILQGSVAPTVDQPVEVTWQYHVPIRGGDVSLEMSLPLPLVNATLASEAPRGLSMEVEGMPAAERRVSQGENILITGVNRQPNDPAVRSFRIHLRGIPAAAGPERTVAAVIAGALVLGALGLAVRRRKAPGGGRDRAELEAERDRILAEMRALVGLRETGEVGPETYARRRRELALWLAATLRALDPDAAPSPSA